MKCTCQNSTLQSLLLISFSPLSEHILKLFLIDQPRHKRNASAKIKYFRFIGNRLQDLDYKFIETRILSSIKFKSSNEQDAQQTQYMTRVCLTNSIILKVGVGEFECIVCSICVSFYSVFSLYYSIFQRKKCLRWIKVQQRQVLHSQAR